MNKKIFLTMAFFFSLISVVPSAIAQTDAEPVSALIDVESVTEVERVSQLSTFDRQLLAELDAQQELLLVALEEEDAFSLKLSELYAEYGALLLKAGRSDEAHDIYTQALHIQKVNHGIYSAEQLYFIKQLIEVAIQTNDTESVDQYLNRAISIEEKNDGLLSEHLDVMFVRAGHYYIDQHYQPARYNVKLALLRNARSYFESIFSRYNNKTIDEVSFPFGELLLLSYLESTLLREMPIIFNGTNERFNVSTLSASPRQTMELERDYAYVKSAYRRSFRSFNDYINKAQADSNIQEEINAMLSWADTLILFNRNREAARYYKMAWERSQETASSAQSHSGFNQPQRIPAYRYLIEREDEYDNREVIRIPLTFSVAKDGSVSNIQMIESNDDHQKYFISARNEASSLHFRPAIIDGDVTAVDEFPYDVKVVVN